MSARFALRFDDNDDGVYNIAFPLFTARGLTGSLAIITGTVGGGGLMTWAQIKEMSDAGWEVLSHSINGTVMTTLSEAQARSNMLTSRDAIIAQGIPCVGFAAPSRGWDSDLETWAADYYDFVSVGNDATNVVEPLPITAPLWMVHGSPSYQSLAHDVSDMTGWIDEAIAADGALMAVTHKVSATPDDNFTMTTADLTGILDYALSVSAWDGLWVGGVGEFFDPLPVGVLPLDDGTTRYDVPRFAGYVPGADGPVWSDGVEHNTLGTVPEGSGVAALDDGLTRVQYETV